jgi:hypothetical protein
MRCFLLCVLVLHAVALRSQFTYFNNRYNNDYASGAKAILESDSGFVISGVSGIEQGENVFLRIVMTAVDFEGNQLWWKTYGEDFHNYYAGVFRSTVKTRDGGFALGGAIRDSIRDVALLIRFDQNGDSLWSKIWGDTVSPTYTGNKFHQCRELPDHGFILIGSTYVSGDDADILMVRTDSLGNTICSQNYGLLHVWEEAYSVAALPDGGFIVGFQKTNLNWLNSHDPGILKVDSLGNQVWMKYYGSSMDEWGEAVAVSQDGNYLFGTTYAVEEPGPWDPLQKVRIIKMDTAGNIIWDRKYGYPVFQGTSCTIDELSDGNILVSGEGGFYDSYNVQGWIIKVRPNGDSIWMRRYDYYHLNQGYQNYLYDIHVTSDQGIILTGEVLGAPEWIQSIWVQKLDSIGCDTAGCDPTVGIFSPRPYSLYSTKISIYPNPASDQVHIEFREDAAGWYSDRQIELYNVTGERMLGEEIPFRASSYDCHVGFLPPGIYFLCIREGQNMIFSGKIVIAR